MTNDEFNVVLEKRMESICNTLVRKAAEYASNVDRLHNFKMGAAMLRCSPAKCCVGFMTKQLVSLFDIVNEIDDGVIRENRGEQIDEKLGDCVNYLILLEALLKETKPCKSAK